MPLEGDKAQQHWSSGFNKGFFNRGLLCWKLCSKSFTFIHQQKSNLMLASTWFHSIKSSCSSGKTISNLTIYFFQDSLVFFY